MAVPRRPAGLPVPSLRGGGQLSECPNAGRPVCGLRQGLGPSCVGLYIIPFWNHRRVFAFPTFRPVIPSPFSPALRATELRLMNS